MKRSAGNETRRSIRKRAVVEDEPNVFRCGNGDRRGRKLEPVEDALTQRRHHGRLDLQAVADDVVTDLTPNRTEVLIGHELVVELIATRPDNDVLSGIELIRLDAEIGGLEQAFKPLENFSSSDSDGVFQLPSGSMVVPSKL